MKFFKWHKPKKFLFCCLLPFIYPSCCQLNTNGESQVIFLQSVLYDTCTANTLFHFKQKILSVLTRSNYLFLIILHWSSILHGLVKNINKIEKHIHWLIYVSIIFNPFGPMTSTSSIIQAQITTFTIDKVNILKSQ